MRDGGHGNRDEAVVLVGWESWMATTCSFSLHLKTGLPCARSEIEAPLSALVVELQSTFASFPPLRQPPCNHRARTSSSNTLAAVQLKSRLHGRNSNESSSSSVS